MALQLILRKGLSSRALVACTRLATSSLPVPDSPVMRMVASEPATWWIISRSSRILRLEPTILSALW